MYGTVDDDYFASLIDPDDPDAPTPLTSHDGDNGFYYWLPVEKDAMFGLVSLRADISQASEPVLEFWYQGQGSTIDVLAAGGTKALAVIKTIDLQAAPTTRWTQARIPLDALKADGAVQFELRLTATHNDVTTHGAFHSTISVCATSPPANCASSAPHVPNYRCPAINCQ